MPRIFKSTLSRLKILTSPCTSSTDNCLQYFCFKNHSTFLQKQSLLTQPDQFQLSSLLLKRPTRHLCIQIHSHLITTSTNPWKIVFNTLLRIYSQGPFPDEALNLYKQFHQTYHDTFTYSFLLKACTNLYQPIKGIQLHTKIIKVGFEFHSYIMTNLVNMYLVCGRLSDGTKVFDEMPKRNLVCWNAMLTGLTRWGELDFARRLLDEMPGRDVISWTGIIDGYVRMHRFMEASTLFRKMTTIDGLKPSELTILAVLPMVWNLGDLSMAQYLHAYSEKVGFNACDIRVSNMLIDAYAKCGCLDSALLVFEDISAERRNVVTWTSMISAFAMHGMAKAALEQFERMEKEGWRPNSVTFLSILHICCHTGFVDEGRILFCKMVNEYRITPSIKHYGCLVDMLARVGRLEEAEKIAMEIPVEIMNVVVWRIVLGASAVHENVEMGERVMKKILEMEKRYGGDYKLMSNMYIGVGKFGNAERVRSLMDERNASKFYGLSMINGNNLVPNFPVSFSRLSLVKRQS